jgi:FKBP-type peptidyl-prolyl cis-trans isomerase FklB
MKSAVAVLAAITVLTGQAFGADDPPLKSQKDKVSYTIGVSSGYNLKRQSIDVDPDIMARGLKDSLTGGKTLLTDQEMQEVMKTLQIEVAARQLAAMAETNKKEGEAFLAENGKKAGVTTLPSGLQYEVLREGNGKRPKPTDPVVVHYRGTLLNGAEFDNSYKRNEPAAIRLDSVINGWKEALPLMKEGAKWRLFIPADLAYGENGSRSVEPNSTLLFEVELISVPKEAAAPALAKPGAKSSKPAAKPAKPAGGK